jgi:hypothetical protein
MAYMISAPEDDVVADLNEWLDGIVFEHEAVFAKYDVWPNESPWAKIGRQRVPLLFGCCQKTCPQPIQLLISDGYEHIVIRWGI